MKKSHNKFLQTKQAKFDREMDRKLKKTKGENKKKKTDNDNTETKE